MNRKAATFVLFVNSLIFALAFHNDTDNDEILRKVGKNEHEFIAINMNKQILKNTTHPQANIGEQKWISQLFLEAERKFDMDEHVNKRCKTDYELYKLHLRNQSVWAVRSKYDNICFLKNIKKCFNVGNGFGVLLRNSHS